jgi:hypothetical protein
VLFVLGFLTSVYRTVHRATVPNVCSYPSTCGRCFPVER